MFETTVVESRRRRTSLRKALTLPVSLAAHGVLIGASLFATVWTVDFPPNPPAQIAQYSVVPPPPPPPPPPPRPAAPPKPPPPEAVAEMLPPSPTDKAPDLGGGVEGGVEGGIEGGVEGGVMGGTLGGVVAPEPPPPEPEAPLRVGGDVHAPVPIRRVQPIYTEIARRARISGVVIIEAIITKEGRVRSTKVLRGLPMGLDEAALAALAEWEFQPATLNGRPVEVIFVLTINFTLKDSQKR